MASDEELRRKAEKRAEEKVSFYIHIAIYIMVNLMLIIIWYVTARGDLSIFPWFIFPLIGWGVGLVAHGVGVFMAGGYQDKLAEKEYQKLKKQ